MESDEIIFLEDIHTFVSTDGMFGMSIAIGAEPAQGSGPAEEQRIFAKSKSHEAVGLRPSIDCDRDWCGINGYLCKRCL